MIQSKYLRILRMQEMGGVKLDYEFTQLIKGLACLMIALHHYAQFVISEGISSNIIYWLFSTQGGDAGVAIFFFLSGYGLMESESRRHLNLFQFLVKRFWKIYKGVLIINFLTLGSIICWKYFQSGVWEPFKLDLLFSIAHLDFVLWFVKVLFSCYLAFTLCSQIRNAKIRNIAFVIGQLLVISYWLITGQSINHIVSIPFFAVGLYVSLYKRKTSKAIRSAWMWLAFAAISGLAVFLSYKTHNAVYVHNAFDILLIACLLWLVSVFDITLIFKSFLGYISFPIYLVHRKIITLSAGLGHLAPVVLYIALTIYLAWLLQKTIEIKIFKNGAINRT